MLGTPELIVVLAIVVLLFGAKKIPDLASGMGKGIRSFKKALNEPDAIDVTPENNEGEKAKSSAQEA
ncbi:MAG: twin-arginine translocase TatA/TatE family subunit [Chrysiogenetes bacterium]|nr:twin-arginine translocase TatA/TatE family subunit [Chrysiogenetes bacterium]